MLLFASSFDHYGTGEALAYRNSGADGGWEFGGDNTWTILGDVVNNNPTIGSNNNHQPYGSYAIETPPWGARRGDYAFVAKTPYIARFSGGGGGLAISGAESPRYPIQGASQHERIIHLAYSVDSLPAVDGIHGHILSLQNSAGEIRGYLGVNPSGRLGIYTGTWAIDGGTDLTDRPSAVALSGSPVIVAETWQSLSIKIITNGVDDNADITIYAGDIIPANLVFNATVALMSVAGNNQIDILGLLPPSLVGRDQISVVDPAPTDTRYLRDLVVCDNTGTYNNDDLGQVFVAAQEMRAEDTGGGWEAFSRENLGTGVLNHNDAVTGVRVGDNAALELGSGDYTLEGFWRFSDLPNTGLIVLASKWDEANDDRSYRLIWDSSADELVFQATTDGITPIDIFRYPWVPDEDKYYHIAAARDSGTFRLFVNGVQFGVDIADANTYHDGAAPFGLMSQWDAPSTLDADTVMQGFLDEFRLTVGVARYTTDFATPTAVFGRNGVDDANFTSVELLCGFDGAIEDESSNAFTVTAGTGVVALEPNDGDNSFEVLNRRPAWDDTYIEARNTFARTILTLDANPTDGETITLGSTTYTYRTALSAGPTVANEILIGADVAETLDHTIKAVNGGTGIGTEYSTGTVANTAVFASALPSPQALFEATAIGTAGNSVASTETLANGSFSSGTTFAGGEDIPSPSDFAIERLPVDVTGILGLQVTARGYKSDAGSAQIRFDLKGPAAAVDTGTALGADLNPSWLRQIFEEDPDTSATITPSTITGGRIRVTRTA